MMTNVHKLVATVCCSCVSSAFASPLLHFCVFFSVHCCCCCWYFLYGRILCERCPLVVLITSYLFLLYCSLEDCILLLQCRLEPECIGCSHRIWCIRNSCYRLHRGKKIEGERTPRQHKAKERKSKKLVKCYFQGILYIAWNAL